MKKIIFGILGLLVIAGIVLFFNLGGAVKAAIELAGTRATGTPVHVSGLDISLADKTAAMHGLSVANPKGFKSGDLLKTKQISVTLGEITKQVVTIKEIVVDGMAVAFELGPQGTNLSAIQDNLRSAPKTDSKSSGPSIIIQRLKIINAQVIQTAGGLQGPVNLPEIVITDIGSKSSPATAVQVATQVMNKVLTASSTAIMKGGLSMPAGDAVNKAKAGLKGILFK